MDALATWYLPVTPRLKLSKYQTVATGSLRLWGGNRTQQQIDTVTEDDLDDTLTIADSTNNKASTESITPQLTLVEEFLIQW